MAFKMKGDPAGNIQKLKIHGGSELFKKSGPPGFFSKLMDPLGLRKKIGGKLCGSKLFNPGGAGGPAAAAQAAAPPAEQAAMPITPAAPAAPAQAAAPVEEAAPVAMRKKNKLTGKPGAPWRFMTEEEEFRVAKNSNKNRKGRLAASKSSTKPTEPAKPVEPTKPTEPIKPVEPTKPVEPAEPTKPTEPTKPKEPTKPTEGKGGDGGRGDGGR